MDQNALKKLVGEESAKYVKNNMVVGLGSGTTVQFLVDALGNRVKNEKLNITCVSTSNFTADHASNLGIIVKSIDDVMQADLTIDGADEIDSNFNGIKGGGAAHLWEKIVATNSKKNMWIVDESKMVNQLGTFPLPLEVIPFGSSHVYDKLDAKGYHPEFRTKDSNRVLTDSKNEIIDLHLGKINHPFQLADELIKMVGVVEHGLFLNIVNYVIVGTQHGIEKLTRPGDQFPK